MGYGDTGWFSVVGWSDVGFAFAGLCLGYLIACLAHRRRSQ